MPLSFIDDWVPKDNERVLVKIKASKENELLSACSFCTSFKVKTTLVVSRSKIYGAKHKKKFEKFGEFDYFGPFTLFSKLKEYHDSSFKFLDNIQYNFSSAMRISGLLNDINVSESNYKLLQFNVVAMFSELHELFWNLVYCFWKQKKDYLFMLPYEIDLENLNDSMKSWDGSDHSFVQRSNLSDEEQFYRESKDSTNFRLDFGEQIGKQYLLLFRVADQSQAGFWIQRELQIWQRGRKQNKISIQNQEIRQRQKVILNLEIIRYYMKINVIV